MPADLAVYDDEPTPAVEVPRFMNMFSLYPEWHRDAVCLGEEDEKFFGASEPDVRPPYTLGDIKRAKAMCGGCPVAAQCLRSALENREEYGVWAGTTRKQRKAMIDAIDNGVTTIDAVIERFEETRDQRAG